MFPSPIATPALSPAFPASTTLRRQTAITSRGPSALRAMLPARRRLSATVFPTPALRGPSAKPLHQAARKGIAGGAGDGPSEGGGAVQHGPLASGCRSGDGDIGAGQLLPQGVGLGGGTAGSGRQGHEHRPGYHEVSASPARRR